MHFALITAPTVTEFRTSEEIQSRAVQQAALQPQLGILSVAAILEQWGDTPHLFDANAEYLKYARSVNNSYIDEFAEHLAELAVRSNADVYGFSSICSTFPLSLRVARSLKERRPQATVLFGGPQASVVDEAVMLRFPFVDFVLRGEVEQSLPSFLRQLSDGYDFARVEGLTFRDGNIVRRNQNASVIEDLDGLLSPSYHLSDYLQGANAASIELGRGCPFSCTFCSTNDFFRRRFRLRSPDRVLAEMRAIAERYCIRHFELVHDMFTVDRKRVIAFCETMRSSGEDFTWDCSARTDCVDEELLEEMVKSGCRGLFFGIESGSTRIQRIIDKDLDPRKAEEMLKVCERLGIRTTASLIMGFPEEEWQDVEDTLHIYLQSARCARSHPQINLLAPLAGTPLHAKHRDRLLLDDYCSDMSLQGLSQAAEDREMILACPEIFPNFYMVATPMLERTVLFELREFLGMAVEKFRWLLCAIGQRTSLLEFHYHWMAFRQARSGADSPGDLRRYYAGTASREDFLRFMENSELATDPVIAALLQVEQTLLSAQQSPDLDPGSSYPQLAHYVRVITLDYDLTELIRTIACGIDVTEQRSFYATRSEPDGRIRLCQISPFLAQVLNLHRKGRSQMIGASIRKEFGFGENQDISGLESELAVMLRNEGWLNAEDNGFDSGQQA